MTKPRKRRVFEVDPAQLAAVGGGRPIVIHDPAALQPTERPIVVQ